MSTDKWMTVERKSERERKRGWVLQIKAPVTQKEQRNTDMFLLFDSSEGFRHSEYKHRNQNKAEILRVSQSDECQILDCCSGRNETPIMFL